MDENKLKRLLSENPQMNALSLDLTNCRLGSPQRSGAMTVVPLMGADRNGHFAPPLSGLKLAGVRGYGNVEMENRSGNGDGVAIVPLHIGYIQDGAQNHALCRSAFIGADQSVTFRDACCVQESQGGYLEGADQWFFVLPLQLREKALEERGVEDYGKLWSDIAQLNIRLGLPQRGHLEQIVCRQRPYLTQYASRFELLPGQTGALFFLCDKLAGIEIAPSSQYFEEVWAALVRFCYGVAAMEIERRNSASETTTALPFHGKDLEDVRRQLMESRKATTQRLMESLRTMKPEQFEIEEEERFLELRLSTVTSRNFTGQIVQEGGDLVYASIFARQQYLLAT